MLMPTCTSQMNTHDTIGIAPISTSLATPGRSRVVPLTAEIQPPRPGGTSAFRGEYAAVDTRASHKRRGLRLARQAVRGGQLPLVALLLLASLCSEALAQLRTKCFMLVETRAVDPLHADPLPSVTDVPALNDHGVFVASMGDAAVTWAVYGKHARHGRFGDEGTIVTDVNNDGLAVAWKQGSSGKIRGVLRQPNGDLKRLVGRRLDFINDSGHIISWSREDGYELIRTADGEVIEVRGLPKRLEIINALATWDGKPFVAAQVWQPYEDRYAGVAWTPDGMVELPGDAGRSFIPVAASNSGVIAGYEDHGARGARAVAWVLAYEDGQWYTDRIDGPWGVPQDINDHDEILMPDGIWKMNTDPRVGQQFVPVLEHMNLPVQFDLSQPLTLRAINNHGDMMGIAVLDDGVRVAFRLMPYDVDNSLVPDYRQILADGAADGNGDWVLDSAQVMRSGFFTVFSTDEQIRAVKPFQALRIIATQDTIEKYLYDPVLREEFERSVTFWGHEHGAELVLTIRNYHDHKASGYDYIPEADEYERVLANMTEFTRRYARYIDYIQLGNEVFTGIGQIWLKPEWIPNDPRFRGGAMRDVEGLGLEDAADVVLGWGDAQAAALREGALEGGRPIRIVTGAISRQAFEKGAVGDPFDYDNMKSRRAVLPDESESSIHAENRSALSTLRMLEFADRVCDIVDLHGRYHHDVDELTIAIEKAFDPDTPWGRRGLIPYNMMAMTEWAPMPDPLPDTEGEYTWFQLHSMEAPHGSFPKINGFAREANPRKFPDPGMTWNQFLEYWRSTTNLDSNYGIGTALKSLHDHGFIFVCYTPFSQYGPEKEFVPYNLSSIDTRYIDEKYVDDPDGFTVYKYEYEKSAAQYEIPDFNPHPRPIP